MYNKKRPEKNIRCVGSSEYQTERYLEMFRFFLSPASLDALDTYKCANSYDHLYSRVRIPAFQDQGTGLQR